MQATLAATALLMGLAGGPHCVAMCGAACAGIGRASGGGKTRSMWTFQAGRLIGYSALGGIAAVSMQGVGWLSIQSAALRPVWTMLHVVAALLGLMLLWQARQPVWLENAARRIWGQVRLATGTVRSGAPLLMGVLWALLPCGLLYSALLVAALTSNPAEGAAVMALFALGSSVSLMAGPWLWLRLRNNGSGRWAIRLAGLALLVTSLWGLWMGLVHNTAPWCLTVPS
jgi:uncharacterized protein